MGDFTRQYDDEYSALEQSIAASGLTKKEIACRLYPDYRPETALSFLSRLLNPEATDMKLNTAQQKSIMRWTRPEDVIYQLCDEFGFERPARKKVALETEIRLSVQGIQKQLAEMMQKLERLEKEKINSEAPCQPNA